MARTKKTPPKAHQASRPARGAPKSPKVATEAQQDVASRQRPGARHSAVQSEATAGGYSKADFLREFGHDGDYHAKCDRATAGLRALAAGNPPAGRTDCGWWWCEKDDLSVRELASLREALNTLRRAGVDPSGPWVWKHANHYRMHGGRADNEKAAYEISSRDIAALEKVQELISGLYWHALKESTIQDLKDELERRKAGLGVPAKPKKPGHPEDTGTRRVLLDYQRVAPMPEDAIEACLILTGARRESARESRVLRKIAKKALGTK